MFYVILLAMVAAFLALRLYSVLGKRTGHEQPLPKAAEERAGPLVIPRAVEMQSEPRESAPQPIEAGAEQGLRQIVQADSGFDVARFIEGSKAAYRMTLEAFWRGDEAELRELANDDVARAFSEAIAARAAAGETLDNRLVSIERAAIAEARVAGREARVAVRFDALIAAVTRDAERKVIAGSLDDAVETHDVWTFVRTLGAPDPNWKLADTDEA